MRFLFVEDLIAESLMQAIERLAEAVKVRAVEVARLLRDEKSHYPSLVSAAPNGFGWDWTRAPARSTMQRATHNTRKPPQAPSGYG